MTTPIDPERSPPVAGWSRSAIVPATCVLLLLHFGQDVLRPLAIAGVLSLVIAPLVRRLTRSGIGRTASTLASVLFVALCVVCMSAVLAMQLVAVGASLPRYKAAIGSKVEAIRDVTVRPFERLQEELKGPAPPPPGAAPADLRAPLAEGLGNEPVAVQIRQATPTASDMVSRLLSSVWGPVGEAGIVFVLLVFILLEHESLSDRFIRVIGVAELGPTVQALSDTAQGVSRFFLSQAVVNVLFGAVVGIALWALGVPHAALWGTLSALLRFVPYVGVLGAAILIAVFSAGADAGWSLVFWSLGLFLALELLVAHVVEPQVYGHSTGLAPLAVIVSALFWGALWGPAGLLLSTPLTLCIVVVGRHVSALRPLAILLTDAPGLNAAQRFYQRALSGHTAAILQDAHRFLKRGSFAKYCDNVLLPGTALADSDFRIGRIADTQLERVKAVVVGLAESLTEGRQGRASSWRRRTVTLTDLNAGAILREKRLSRLGPWQGGLDVPSKSITLCIGLGSDRDDLMVELLVRSLRLHNVDARSISAADVHDPSMSSRSVLIGTVFLAYPTEMQFENWKRYAADLKAALPQAIVVSIRHQVGVELVPESTAQPHVDLIIGTYSEAEALVVHELSAPA